jgi:hypothetical protein
VFLLAREVVEVRKKAALGTTSAQSNGNKTETNKPPTIPFPISDHLCPTILEAPAASVTFKMTPVTRRFGQYWRLINGGSGER